MATFEEMLQHYVNLDYEDLLATAQKAIVELLPSCKAVDKDNNGFMMLTSIMLTAIGADGVLTNLERTFLKDALNVDDDTVSKFIKLYDSRMVELVDQFADKISKDIKVNVLTLVLCITSVDEKISREETALIRKLLD